MTDVTPAEIRTFLIADVRGYTAFTQKQGDEAAARLAARFADVVREEIEARDGRVVELRGDEALCVFGSPRAALRAAVALQQRCAAEMRANPQLPLAIGIGIDAGEAVEVQGGFRGGALNLAARLCSTAQRGEVLVSSGIVHLARRTDEIGYIDLGQRSFKGLDHPVQVYQLSFDLDLPDAPAAGWWTRPRIAIAAATAAVVLVCLGAVVVATSGGGHPQQLGTNVLGIVNSSGQIDGSVALPSTPAGVAGGAGSIWATVPALNRVDRIDPDRQLVVDTVPLPAGARAPTGIAVGGGGVWVADSGSSAVSWINPGDTGAVRQIRVGQGPGPIAYADGAAWVVNVTDATLQRIDAHTLKPGKPIAVGGSPSAIAVGGGWVWVADRASSTVLKIDPKTRQVVNRLRAGATPVGLAYGGGQLWTANADDGTVTRLDPATGRSRPIPVGRQPSSVAYTATGVWATTAAGVARVDHDLGVHLTPTGSTVVAGSGLGDRVWVAAAAAPASHRGGTLKVAIATNRLSSSFGPFDPAVAPYPEHWQLISLVSDGLLTYRRAGGPAGLEVVPDLAVSLPTVSNGGRTYTFQLRKGLRYSDGRAVHAADFRSSVERTLSTAAVNFESQGGYARIMFSSIAGFATCDANPGGCSFAKGIQTNDQTGTITIHLSQPDPALPRKLATSFAALVEPGAPQPDSGKPVIGTGPYRVASWKADGSSVVLVRNRYFHQWSAQAQPAGYPNRILWAQYPSFGAELTAVEQGAADVMVDQPPTGRLAELDTRFATLAHTVGGTTTEYLALNTHVGPFRSLDARRAVNFALDRRALATALGGAAAYAPTCQVLPPEMFGYAPYCPYTAGSPATGTWSAADLERARALVQRSGTAGDQVAIWVWGGDRSRPLATPIAATLRKLGYRASVHATPPTAEGFGAWNDQTSNSHSHVSAVLGGWAADYPNPSDFLDVLLSCSAYHPGSRDNLNTAEICNPGLDALIHRAEAVQASDPARSAVLWQQADRAAVDLAAWAPLLNNVQTDVVAPRVGNYQHHAEWGVLLGQLWVR